MFVFCKMNIFLLSSLSNMIIDSVSCWVCGQWVCGWGVGGRLVDESVVRGFNKTQEKNMFEVLVLPLQFGRGLFCYSSFSFFYIDNKVETNLIARSSHSNLTITKDT